MARAIVAANAVGRTSIVARVDICVCWRDLAVRELRAARDRGLQRQRGGLLRTIEPWCPRSRTVDAALPVGLSEERRVEV